jgi:hypothetical protein
MHSNKSIKSSISRAPVSHACNPSYAGGRDQEDLSLKPAPGKNPSQKRTGGVAQAVRAKSTCLATVRP